MFLLTITNNSVTLYKVYSVFLADKGQFNNVAMWKKEVVHGVISDTGWLCSTSRHHPSIHLKVMRISPKD